MLVSCALWFSASWWKLIPLTCPVWRRVYRTSKQEAEKSSSKVASVVNTSLDEGVARKQIACERARQHLLAVLKQWLLAWADRLETTSGLKAILQVSAGFKLVQGTIAAHDNRHHM